MQGRTWHLVLEMLLGAVLNCIKNEFKQESPAWKILSKCPENDMAFLKKECNAPSEFDPMRLRKAMIDGLENRQSHMTVASCQYGTVYAVYNTPDQYYDIPWGLWGRILRMYTEDLKKQKPFKIFFLASNTIREFPKGTKPITPLNINGGYTYQCNHETIMIYRAEDATRVLLHELMHACCLDKPENGVDVVEAETEAWAELMYVGFLSRGNKQRFGELLKKQSDWIQIQNDKVRRHMKSPMAFPWRYTVGKEEVWRRWNIIGPHNDSALHNDSAPHTDHAEYKPMTSLRLTCPPDNTSKKNFNVRFYSVIL